MYNRKVLSILMACALAGLVCAAPQSGRVRSVLGDVSFQKKGKGDFEPLRVKAKVVEGDVIKTDVESDVLISTPDGSTISIGEKALVVFSQLMFKNDYQITDMEVKRGMVAFDAQKQNGSKSKFRFKTGTATASIRGTDGTVGVTEGGLPYGALNSGEMVMERDGAEVTVKPQQFVAFRKDAKPIVVAAKNAGSEAFAEQIGAALDDTTKSVEAVMETAKQLDNEIETKLAELKSKYSCSVADYPKIVYENAAEIKANCTKGMSVSLGSQQFKSEGSEIVFTPEWNKGSVGVKKYVLNCTVGEDKFECGRIEFTYEVIHNVELLESNSSKCEAKFRTTGYDENEDSLHVFLGDSLVKSIVTDRDTVDVFRLVPGAFEYRLVAYNKDPGLGRISKRLECYPSTDVKVAFRGGSEEVIRRNISQGVQSYPELQFDLLNVMNNEQSQIKSVEVSVGGKVFETKYIPSKEGIGYSAKVRVQRGNNEVLVKVEMMNGMKVSAKKTYRLR